MLQILFQQSMWNTYSHYEYTRSHRVLYSCILSQKLQRVDFVISLCKSLF